MGTVWQRTEEQQPRLIRGKSTFALEDAVPAFKSSSSKAKQLALQAPEPKVQKLVWKALEKTVGDAKDANERLQRECNRLVVKVRSANDEKLIEEMKKMVAQLSESLLLLNQCQMWEQIPNSDGNEASLVEEFFDKLANKTEEVHEAVEKTKAVLKARCL